jgi:hypothetical protein
MVIAEEGRGVIVRGEGSALHNIQAPQGRFHVLSACVLTAQSPVQAQRTC